MMKYKNYTAAVWHDETTQIFRGQVVGISDRLVFDGKTPDDLESAFQSEVDKYLQTCAAGGIEPETNYSGKFTVRAEPELHRLIAASAQEEGISMNLWVVRAIELAFVLKKENLSKPLSLLMPDQISHIIASREEAV